MNNAQHLKLQGFYKLAVVDALTGQEIWRQPEWEKNLIINNGMDGVASQYLANLLLYGVAGTGSRFNELTSSVSQASAINGTVYLVPSGSGIQSFTGSIYGGWSSSFTSGDTIKFANGLEATSSGTPTGTTATISYTGSVSTQSFTIWKTSQTGLEGESKRGGSGIAGSAYLTGAGNCGYTLSGNILTYLRTYDFSAETGSKTYTEVGVAWSSTVGAATTFSRIRLPASIFIDNAQRLRLIYQLQVTFSPTASSYISNAVVNGWPVSPATNTNLSQSLQLILASTILAANGATLTTTACLDPVAEGSSCTIFGSTNSQSLVTFGSTPVDRSTNGSVALASSTLDSYVARSFECYKNATFTVSLLNYTNLRSFGFGINNPGSGYYPYNTTGQAFAMLFEQSQSKYSTQTLTMTYKWSWSRVLA